MRSSSASVSLVLLGVLAMLTLGGCSGGRGTSDPATDKGSSWVVQRAGGVLHVHYGSGIDYPEYAALHLTSSYLRLVPTRTSNWGTSVILMPAFWSATSGYLQAAPVTARKVYVVNGNLVIPFSGTLGGLTVNGTVRLWPPADGKLKAVVKATTSGTETLQPGHAGERFKPLMLSSMHESATMWDARSATVAGKTYAIPASGWIIQPATTGTSFALRGGTSTWNANAPTIMITMPQSRWITGWVTPSSDPNDDNVGFWAAADEVLPGWQYTIVAK